MDKGTLNRHDMLFLNEEGLAHARHNARPEALACHLGLGIPAVVARQQQRHEDGTIEVGFPLPLRQEGSRLRAASLIPQEGIRRCVTPFEAATGSLAPLDKTSAAVVAELLASGRRHGLEVGLYGSLAMGLLTGLDYFSDGSDYDIFLRPNGHHTDVPAFYYSLKAIEVGHRVKIDAEIACLEDSGAKLAELFSGQKTVLCKGLYGVEICPIKRLGLL